LSREKKRRGKGEEGITLSLRGEIGKEDCPFPIGKKGKQNWLKLGGHGRKRGVSININLEKEE